MYIYTYKSITTKWWDNPRLAKQAVAKKEKNRPDSDILNTTNHAFILIDNRMKELTEEGYNVVQVSDTISPQDEASLWETGTFSLDTARGLSYCVFYYNGNKFGLRGGNEHRNLTLINTSSSRAYQKT